VIGPEAPDPGALPEGVSAIGAPTPAELVWWLREARAVVPGDTILGDDRGGLALCPASWLDGGGSVATLAAELRPLLDLPVERVLVSHGTPVLSGGRDALVRALSS
jgi:glyoxylase-like metal-dependent hydrolase (beta-lactamase superfamily II)